MAIRVQKEEFDVGHEITMLCAGNSDIGGLCSFIGLVRENQLGDTIKALTLEHYSGMTEKQLAKIEIEANDRWELKGSLIIHRYGRMVPGEKIVLVATASAHRKAAFESCEFLIDWLKTKAPFWKNEETPEGRKWVESQVSDDIAADSWQK